MKKICISIVFSAAAGMLAATAPVAVSAKSMDDWVEYGLFEVQTDTGYPKNVQDKDEESRIGVQFKVHYPYLFNKTTEKDTADLYWCNRVAIVAVPGNDYAAAGGGEQWYAWSGARTVASATFSRLKSGQTYTVGCFAELIPTSDGLAWGCKPTWIACESPPTVTTSGTDVPGRTYFRFTGGLNYGQNPVSFEGGGVCRVGGVQSVTPYNTGFSYDYGTHSNFLVVHTPLGSPSRVEFFDGMDPTDFVADGFFFSKRVWVKDQFDVSKASSLVHRCYWFWSTYPSGSPGHDEEFALPYPGVVFRSGGDALTINVPQNQQ